jgi:hypothetical protein
VAVRTNLDSKAANASNRDVDPGAPAPGAMRVHAVDRRKRSVLTNRDPALGNYAEHHGLFGQKTLEEQQMKSLLVASILIALAAPSLAQTTRTTSHLERKFVTL